MMYDKVQGVRRGELRHYIYNGGRHALADAFTWRSTIQGNGFWEHHYNKNTPPDAPRDKQWLEGLERSRS